MHDPMTVAFEIRWPFPRRRVMPNGTKWEEYVILATIWHCDPETDGSDDSCGWFTPNLTERERQIIDKIVEWDLKFPYFSSDVTVQTSVVFDLQHEFRQQSPGDCLGMVAAAWDMIAWTRDRRRKLTAGEWWEVVGLATNPDDNLRSVLSDPQSKPQARAKRFLFCVMRYYLKYHLPWWKHPRFHLHHWRVQIPFVQNLQRWLFSRCAGCGGRFRWGESPTSMGWNGGGPRWFKGEQNVYHNGCVRSRSTPDSRTNNGDCVT